jgi:hemerythrin-like domain-containing protein
MAATIPLLRSDHVNFARLLNTLEHQVEIAEIGGAVSNALISMMFIYFREYPQKVHHPKEDLIYNALILHLPDMAANVFHIIREHEQLSEYLESVEQSFRAYNPDSPDSVQIFCYQARRFIAKEREHMALEESHLYPMAVHRLTSEQWSGIDRFMANERDPLFGDTVAAPYQKLAAGIISLDETLRPLY